KPFFISIRNSAVAMVLFLALWALFSLFSPAYLVPSPAAVLGSTIGYLKNDFFHHLLLTLMRVLTGFVAAFLLGSTVGLISAGVKQTQSINTFLVLCQVIPGTILGIIFLLLLGIGSRVPIAMVIFLVLPIVAINTANALLKRNPLLENYLRSIGAKRAHFLTHIYLPALIPTFQSNLTIGFGLSLKVVILGEFIGSQDGIGYLLNLSRIYFKMDQVFFWLLVVVLIMGCFQILQNLLFTVFLGKYFYPE
ncbi:ABC transporter permease subunit, partial [bacterium]|nr:ABC transporter permease subunit [bacterium]